MDVRQSIAMMEVARTPAPAVNTPTDTAESGELVAERTESAKVFDLGNGQRRAKVYTCPVHYHDGSCFRSIDHTVKRKPLDDPLPQFPFEAKSGLWHAHFDAVKPWNYRFELGDSCVEHEALFDESDSLSIKVDTHNAGVKETITLLDEKAPTRFDWRTQWSKSKGGIIVPNPTAVDAGGRRVPVHIQESDGILTCELDVAAAKFPIQLDPTSVTATNDGNLDNYSAAYGTYESARDVSTAAEGSSVYLYIGQFYSSAGHYYTVSRALASFVLPDMVSLSAASFFGEGKLNASATDFDVYIHTGTQNTPYVVGDFDLFDGHQASGAYNGTVLNDTWNTSSFSDTWNEIVFNAAGRTALFAKKNNTFKLFMLSKNDYDSTAPTGDEYIWFESSSTAGKEPYLSITYIPVQLPAPVFMNHYRRRRAS